MAELRSVTPAERGRWDADHLAEVARRQCGVVSRAQLRSCGLGGNTIDRWLGAGRLHAIHPGVYALGHAATSLEGRLTAALLYAGPDALLSHTTAGWLWSMIDVAPKRIHVTVPGRRGSLPGVRVHRSRSVERDRRRGFAVSAPARTLLDLAAILPHRQLRRALAEADYRGLLNPSEVEATLRRGRPGGAALRRALDDHLPELARTRSVLEERFLALCDRGGLPRPEVNVTIAGLLVDAHWPGHGLVVELDGHAAHGRPAAIEVDRRRELILRGAGRTVVRYTWDQITRDGEAVIADLRAVRRG